MYTFLYGYVYLNRFGCCEVVISDQGREFVNQIQDELYRLTGTKHRVTSAYHPQTNGLTERFNQTLQTALLKLVNDTQTDWDEHLPAVLFAYRTSQQKATQLTPFEVMFCRYVMIVLDRIKYSGTMHFIAAISLLQPQISAHR